MRTNHDKEQDHLLAKVIRNRKRNSYAILTVFVFLTAISIIGYNQFSKLQKEEVIQSEITQIVIDEGYKRCSYKDSLGKLTIGFGHLVLKDDKLYKNNAGKGKLCITPSVAVAQLRLDYEYASNSVKSEYDWADEEVALVLTNMTYQLGEAGVSKFKITLDHLKKKEYDEAAGELLNSSWAAQTPKRASRLAGRIMALN